MEKPIPKPSVPMTETGPSKPVYILTIVALTIGIGSAIACTVWALAIFILGHGNICF